MITPLNMEHIEDLSQLPLGPSWLRRPATEPDRLETPGPGVWRTGPEAKFRARLVAAMDEASEVVLLCSFLLADDVLAAAMLRAADRGVRVYVLTASEQRIGRLTREDSAFDQRMVAEHKQLLDRLTGRVLLRSAEHIHAKFLVVDPASATPRAWLSTANFNKALTDSVELGVQLDGADARALGQVFTWGFWCEAERELRDERRLAEVRPGAPASPPRPIHDRVLTTLRDGNLLREHILKMIAAARREIIVSSYSLSPDHATTAALRDALRRGVRVTVLTRTRKAVADAVTALAEAGANVVAHDKLHAKAVLADGEVVVMTANLEAQGLDHGFEVGASLTGAVKAAVAETLRSWAVQFPWVFHPTPRRADHLGEICPASGAPDRDTARVVEEHHQPEASVTARDALRLTDASRPTTPAKPPTGTLPRRVRHTWQVLPPSIPKGARERTREVEVEEADKDGRVRPVKKRVPFEPPVFEANGQVWVRLRDVSEADAASALARQLDAVVAL
jgi:cardiolipin synthase